MFCTLCQREFNKRAEFLVHTSLCKTIFIPIENESDVTSPTKPTSRDSSPVPYMDRNFELDLIEFDDSDTDPSYFPEEYSESDEEEYDVEGNSAQKKTKIKQITLEQTLTPETSVFQTVANNNGSPLLNSENSGVQNVVDNNASPLLNSENSGIQKVADNNASPLLNSENSEVQKVSETPEMNASLNAVITPISLEKRGNWSLITTPKGEHKRSLWCPAVSQDESPAKRRYKRKLYEDQEEGERVEKDRSEEKKLCGLPTVCPYCGEYRSTSNNFISHLKSQHSDKDTVKKIIQLSKVKGSRKEVQKLSSSLRKIGRYQYMQKKDEEVIPCKSSQDLQKTITCNFCLGGYSSNNFRHHWRSCPQRPTSSLVDEEVNDVPLPQCKKKIIASKQFSSAIAGRSIVNDDRLLKAKEILHKNMRMNHITKQALNDELILKFAAEKLPGVEIDIGKLDYLRQGVRDLSRLLGEMKKLDISIKCLRDCFTCSKYPTIIQAVYNLSGTDYITGMVAVSSYNIRMRSPIGLCLQILLSEARTQLKGSERDERLKELTIFEDELTSSWARKFGSLAERMSKDNRHGKIFACADPDNVKMVFNSCHNKLKTATAKLKEIPNSENYDSLMKLTINCIFATSRRRSCDLQKLTVGDFKSLDKNRELCDKVGHTLNLPEDVRNKMSEMYCIFSCGKDQMSTAILLTEDMKVALEAIIEARVCYKVVASLMFVKLQTKPEPWRVGLALEWAKKVFPLKDPKNYGVRGLRHLTATVGQYWKQKNPDIGSVFQEGLSHSDRIHNICYKGNLASRIIQGYGIPILEDLRHGSKEPCETITSNEVVQPENQNTFSELTQADCQDQEEGTSNETGVSKTVFQNIVEISEHPREIILGGSVQDVGLELMKNKKEVNLEDQTKKKVTRKTWSTEEDYAIIRQFYQIVKRGLKVTSIDLENAKMEEPILKIRSDAQIRARISQIKSQQSTTCARLSSVINKLESPEAKKYGK